MALLAEYIPEHDRIGFAFEIVDLQLLRALENFRIISARLTNPSEIPFHVRHKDGNATRAEIFRERLQRDCLSGPSRAGDQAVTVRHLRQQIDRFLRLCDEDRFVSHGTGVGY